MPEEYFVKQKNGRYVSIGSTRPEMMFDGLYFHQNQKYGSRTTSVQHWAGYDPQQPIDVNRLVDLMKYDDDVAAYLSKLQDGNSEEYKKLKKNAGGYVTAPPRIFNISMCELAQAVLRFLYEREMEKQHANRKSKRNAL